MEKEKKPKKIEVDESLLISMQEHMAETDRKMADMEAKNAGLLELVSKEASTTAEPKIREKKNFEPKFRTVRVRKYPMGGTNDLGYVIGWTDRGAYQEVDRNGISPQIVDYIDIIYLGYERTPEGKLKAEKVKLLDLFNKGVQVHCKILDTKRNDIKVPTGEEIDVSVFDPNHGLVSNGEKVDGYVTKSEIQYTIQIPGVLEPVIVDGLFVN